MVLTPYELYATGIISHIVVVFAFVVVVGNISYKTHPNALAIIFAIIAIIISGWMEV